MSRALRPNYDQLFLLPPSLDDWVPRDHPVRFVRDFVETLDLPALQFRQFDPGDEGRPHYAPDLLLKVWLYGWMERVRSSRALEKACLRDVAFLWLTGNLHPDHNTLWRFFRDNKKALRHLFKRIVRIAADAGLVGFALHALDGTKLAAASSTDTTFSRKDLLEQLKELDAVVEAHLAQVEKAEVLEPASYVMPKEMLDAKARQAKIREALAQLDAAETNHLHPNEPEARLMMARGHAELGYNAQAVVDHDSDLIVAAEVVTEQNDKGQLVPMVEEVVATLGRSADQTVADAGYWGGEQIAEAERRRLPVLVTWQEPADGKGDFDKRHFQYDAARDGYVCPRGELLTREGERKPTQDRAYPLTTYRCHNADCPVRASCSKDPKGRTVGRTPYDDALERQAQRQASAPMRILLSLRREIVEHLFGIVKALDGFRRFTARGLEGARAQWALACAAVDLRKLYAFWRQGRLVLNH